MLVIAPNSDIWIDEVFLVKGTAGSTSDYTPPTVAYGGFPTGGEKVKTENLALGASKVIPVSKIGLYSDLLANDNDIQVAISDDEGVSWSSFYNLDSSAANKFYPIKAGQIGGNSVTVTDLMFDIKYNSDGDTDMESLAVYVLDIEPGGGDIVNIIGPIEVIEIDDGIQVLEVDV